MSSLKQRIFLFENRKFKHSSSRHISDYGFCSLDRKSTRLNSSHSSISYAVFCLKKKKVRNLTDSSLCLAQDIAELVRQATAPADHEMSMAQEVSGKMHEIAVGVCEVDRLIGALA